MDGIGPCNVCDKPCDDFVLCFVKCNFNVHKLCAELPKRLRLSFHPQHPLTLFRKNPYGVVIPRCDACKKPYSGCIFHCAACTFDLNTECASLVPTLSYEALSLIKFTCDQPCTALVLRCVKCNFTLHKTCAELPKQIKHPFHPLHALTLFPKSPLSTRARPCNACGSFLSCIIFQCMECNFNLDIGCATREPNIKYEGHEHVLTLFQKCNWHGRCNFCGIHCDSGVVLRCVECNLNLHIYCHPSFPRTMKHKCHKHPSTFMNSIGDHDGSGVFSCNACGKKRNPKGPVYYCAECSFVTHISCVIRLSKVLPLLMAKQESTDIKRSTVRGYIGPPTGNDVMAGGFSAPMPSEKVGVEVTADPALSKLDGEISKLQEKLKALQSECAQHIVFKMLSARDENLSEGSTLKE